MLVRSLTLANVGVYRGHQQIRFSTTATRPITLVGGRNGAGKTSLLESIPLVLYGNRARRILNGVAYPEYLNNLVHHGERTAAILLEFDRAEEGRQVRYLVERTWNRSSRGRSTDRLFVTTDGEPRSDLVAAWPEFVEGIMPLAVADLAIFDGEKIESLADPLSSASVLRTSLYGLLGLDLVERLRADLQSYRRRAAKAHDCERLSGLSAKLGEAEARLAQAIGEQDAAVQAREAAEGARADLERQLQRATDALEKAGGGLLAQRDELHRRLAEATASADATDRELLQLASSDLPLTLIPALLKAVAAAGEQLEAWRLAHQIHDSMVARDGRLIPRLVEALSLQDDDVVLVQDLLASDLKSVEHPPLPAFSPTLDCSTAARNLLDHRGPELISSARRLSNQLVEQLDQIEQLEATLAAVPDADRISSTVQLVAAAEAELRVAERSVERALLACGEADRRAALAQREVDAVAHQVLSQGAADANASRIAREVASADEVLEAFANQMVQKHLGEITNQINAALKTLLRKQGLVAGVSIDPTELSVALLDGYGSSIDTRRLSAGERQIMATAVLWGLSRCTGMTLPTVIDTPVGRLDRSHRMNLVERYFPHASRQVVLLSTDEEIVGDHLERLLPHVGAQYRLDFDEREACTSIVEGYLDD